MEKVYCLKVLKTIGLALILGASLTACGASSTEWKEEVLLHDGSKIVVERSQSYGGRHEIGQSPAIKEQRITFTLPNTKKPLPSRVSMGKTLGVQILNYWLCTY